MSAEVVDINAERDERSHDLFNAFVKAQKRALETLKFTDGMAAREAWRRFLMSCETPEQRRASVTFLNAGRR